LPENGNAREPFNQNNGLVCGLTGLVKEAFRISGVQQTLPDLRNHWMPWNYRETLARLPRPAAA